MKIAFAGLLLFLMLSGLSVSQAAYITDKLVAGLYKEAAVSDKPVKALNSGTPLEVVSRKAGFVKVRTSDGTIGWVEETYLTDEKPARSMLLDVQAKISILQKQLEAARGARADTAAGGETQDLSAWQEKLTRAQGQISQLEIQLQAARLNAKKFEQSQEQFDREKQQLRSDLQARTEAATAELKKENQVLHEQIRQVAKVLNIQPAGQADSETTQAHDVIEILKARWSWIFFAFALIVGFSGGYFYMRHKVTQRFGGVFKL